MRSNGGVGLPGQIAGAAVAVKVAAIVLLEMGSSAGPPLTWLIFSDSVSLWAAEAAVDVLLDPRHSCFWSPAYAVVFEGALLLSTAFEWYLVGVVIDGAIRRVWRVAGRG